MKTAAVLTEEGTVRIPPSALAKLGVHGAVTVDLDVSRGKLVLRPNPEIPPEDAWAYTHEHREAVKRSREDARAGRVRQLSEADLDRIAGD